MSTNQFMTILICFREIYFRLGDLKMKQKQFDSKTKKENKKINLNHFYSS